MLIIKIADNDKKKTNGKNICKPKANFNIKLKDLTKNLLI